MDREKMTEELLKQTREYIRKVHHSGFSAEARTFSLQSAYESFTSLLLPDEEVMVVKQNQ
jgi:hypothetical protein